MAAVQYTVEVHAQKGLPVGGLAVNELERRKATGDARVVDQQVGWPEFFFDGSRHLEHGRVLAHVGGKGRGPAAGVVDQGRGFFGALGHDVIHRHRGPQSRERLGHGAAYSPAGPGNHCCPAVKRAHNGQC